MSSASSPPVGVGIIGCGYWGPNHVRNFSRHPDFRVVVVCDVRRERAEAVARDYHVPNVVTDPRRVLDDPAVDLVVVATPTRTHFELAKAALQAGKHLLVMKPMTTRVDHAEELVYLARRAGRLLAVDHTFLFTGAVRKMRDLITSGEIGDVYYIDSVRINLGLFQSDVNVIWDLAAHDVSIIDHLLEGELPREVSAVGAAHAGSPTENVAYVTLRYRDNLLAHVHANWLAPAKVRRTIVGGSKRMVIWDDTQPSEKLLVYDKGVLISPRHGEDDNAARDPYGHMISYRSGDMFAPRLDDREALAAEVDDIAACLRTGRTPLVDGDAGLRTVVVLEAAQRSLTAGSEPVRLTSPGSLSVPDVEAQVPRRPRPVAVPIVVPTTTDPKIPQASSR
jgi:predicted dehydrogenase